MYTCTQRVSDRGQMGHFTPQPGPSLPSLHWELRNSSSDTGRKQKAEEKWRRRTNNPNWSSCVVGGDT